MDKEKEIKALCEQWDSSMKIYLWGFQILFFIRLQKRQIKIVQVHVPDINILVERWTEIGSPHLTVMDVRGTGVKETVDTSEIDGEITQRRNNTTSNGHVMNNS